MDKDKELVGALSINAVQAHDDRYIHIDLVDESSSCLIAQIKIDFKEFGQCITGQSHMKCSYMLIPDNSGKKLETKHEHVFVPDGPYDDRDKIAKRALKPHENDGWRGDMRDATNHTHRCVKHETRGKIKGAVMDVAFRRYV